MSWVLCQDCLAVAEYSDARYDGVVVWVLCLATYVVAG